jgi:hypothetical protein
VKKALALVVKGGTAGRLQGVLKDASGQEIVIGGKTGTGDHRYERYGAGGQLIESRVVNRTATFVFYLGEHYFGTFTALVPGPQAGQYEYTSSMVAQILKNLLPQLKPALFPASRIETPPVIPETPSLPVPTRPQQNPAPVPIPPTSPGEKPEGSSSQADPQVQSKPDKGGGFPDTLDPGVVVPVPSSPPGGSPDKPPGWLDSQLRAPREAGQTAL